jgi:hypothetical protein
MRPGWQDYIIGNAYKTPLCDLLNNSQKTKYLRSLQKNTSPNATP